jgi:hypothetical protein
MAAILSRRLKPRDDPMFSGGLETFSFRGFNPSSKNTAKSTDGANPVELPETGELTTETNNKGEEG